MAEAFRGNIIFPNKQVEQFERFYNGHLIDSETYIGGHVECLQSGVFRSDFPQKFRFEKKAYQNLINEVTKVMVINLISRPWSLVLKLKVK
jgi:DNA polymerase epsilon subunit 1